MAFGGMNDEVEIYTFDLIDTSPMEYYHYLILAFLNTKSRLCFILAKYTEW